MKKLLLAATLIACTSTAMADIESCEEVGDFSLTVMSSRQIGTPMSDILKITKDYEGHIIPDIVRDAWNYRVVSGVREKNLAAEAFKNEQLVTCYRAMTR